MRLYIEPDRKTWAGLCVRPDTGAKEIDTKVRQHCPQGKDRRGQSAQVHIGRDRRISSWRDEGLPGRNQRGSKSGAT